VNQRSPSKPAVICYADFNGVPGGESGDAPLDVPLVDPAVDVGFQGGDPAVGRAAQLAGWSAQRTGILKYQVRGEELCGRSA
jgi:hypothetical protein